MKDKQKFILKILKKYGLLVDFEGDPPRTNLPGPVEGETFRAWSARVLYCDPRYVTVYGPIAPASNKKVSRLADETKMDFVDALVLQAQRSKEKEAAEEREMQASAAKALRTKLRRTMKAQTAQELEEAKKLFASVGTETIQDLLDSNLELANSVREYLERVAANADRSSANDVFTDLVSNYNVAVLKSRELQIKLDKLES